MIGHDFPYLDTRDINLDWLLRNMKQILADWAEYQQTMNQNFSDLESAVAQFESDITTAFNTLHDYVEDYFDNLDVQQEINNKLNAMKNSGELAQIMNPLVSTQTAAWLSTHITNPSNPPIDTSLTVSGAAADAKVTGDKITKLQSGFDDYIITERQENGERNISTFRQGGLASGYVFPLAFDSSATRVHTPFFYINKGDVLTIDPGTCNAAFWAWTGNPDSGTPVNEGGFRTTRRVITINTQTFACIVFADGTNTSAEITPADIDATVTVTPYVETEIEDRNIYVDGAIESIVNYDAATFPDWAQGAAYKRTGGTDLVVNDLSTRCHVVPTIINPFIKKIYAKPGFQFAVCACTLSGTTYTVVENWNAAWKTELDVSTYSEDYYIAISVGKSDTTADITPDEAAANILYTSTFYDKLESTIKSSVADNMEGVYSPLLRPAGPRVVAHRGLMGRAPENTVPAFTLAGQGGAWGIETDIWESADGYFICNHNNDVSGMTDGTGNITEMTYAQIMACTVDNGVMIPSYPNLKLATLEQYLTICRRYGCVAVVEVKGITHYDNFVQTIKEYGMLGSTAFLTTWTLEIINSLRSLCNTPIIISASNGDYDTLIANAATKSDIWVQINKDYVVADYVATAHTANIAAGAWAYLNVADMTSAIELGLDYIFANNFATIDA